jgi:hypothetical protein
MRSLGLCWFIAALASASIAAAGETRLTIVDASPTSWVAHGYKNYTLTPDTGWIFTPSRNFDNGISFDIVLPNPPQSFDSRWSLQFAAPLEALIAPGLYPNFERFPFQPSVLPGLSFTGGARGDNRATGFFNVREVTYDPTGSLTAFAVDVTHYGDRDPANWAIVELRYNSSVPEPGSGAGVAMGVFFGFLRRRAFSHG